MPDRIEFEPDIGGENVDFDADLDFEDAVEEPSVDGRFEELRARGREAFSSAAEQGRERLYQAADRGKNRLADVMVDAAAELDGRIVYSAEYLRTNDIDVIRDDLVTTVRKHPLVSAGVAIGAGYLIGKALGGFGGGRKGRRKNTLGKQIGRALISAAGAAIVKRISETPRPEG